MRTFVILIFVAIVWSSCTFSVDDKNGRTEISQSPVEIVRTSAIGDQDKTVATLKIEGMMCQMACGGKIKKELFKLDGARDVQVTFDPDKTLDEALVEYDPSQLTPEEMITCVNKIADGKLYAVKELTVTQYSVGG